MIILRYLTKFCPEITKFCLSKNLVYLLNIFLSPTQLKLIKATEDMETLNEVRVSSIYILDAILPQMISLLL